MAKITRIERLVFGENDAQAEKGAGWVTRTCDLRISKKTTPDFTNRQASIRGLASRRGAPSFIERKYRTLRRKGLASVFQRIAGSLHGSFRPFA